MQNLALNSLKFGSVFLGGFQAQNIVNNYFRVALKYDEPQSSKFQTFIQSKNLKSSKFYDDFRDSLQESHYVQKVLCKDGNCLGVFKTYFHEEVANKLDQKSYLTDEEKLKFGKIYTIICPNTVTQGNMNIAHGGFTATLIDNLMGNLSGIVNDYGPSATAYLNITYKKPIKCGNEYLIICELEKQIGKKNYFQCKIQDENDIVVATAEALFIKVDWSAGYWKKHMEKQVDK